ncbi:MAG: hypothetical protein K9M98_14595 [Cephaloticoccus sp.]|nr:hypothetical protein [Cephaloticoccus sp.]MCF7761725.1 hypothetical protein [Cephaloticoccus sp.]
MIERLGELVRTVMNRNGSPERNQDQIDELAIELTGLPSTTLLTLPEAEVYRLIEESSRMVPEKCYVVAELCRVQGLLATNTEERRSLFNRALFFYQNCVAELEDKLGETIVAHQAEMKEAMGGVVELNPDVRQHVVPVERPRSRKSKQSWGWSSRLGIVAVLALLGLMVFRPTPDYEITGTTWQSNGREVVVNCLLHNRAESSKLLTVQFIADFANSSAYKRSLSFAGSTERSFRVEPDSELSVEVQVPLAGGRGGDVLLTVTIVSVE